MTESGGGTRFLALGDSYTIGEGVAAGDRWLAQLAARLRERGVEVGEPLVIARTGWTTDDLDAGISAVNPRPPFALVTLLVGVNDQYRGRGAEEYRGPFRDLLRRAVRLAGGDAGRVVVVSVPDWGVTPFAAGQDRAGIAARIDQFNAVNRDETAKAGARYVDVAPESRRDGTRPGFLAADGLHPSASMYAEWTALVLPAALDALGRGG